MRTAAFVNPAPPSCSHLAFMRNRPAMSLHPLLLQELHLRTSHCHLFPLKPHMSRCCHVQPWKSFNQVSLCSVCELEAGVENRPLPHKGQCASLWTEPIQTSTRWSQWQLISPAPAHAASLKGTVQNRSPFCCLSLILIQPPVTHRRRVI